MYNPEATRLLIVVFFFMLIAIAGGMMMLPGDDESDTDVGIAQAMVARMNHVNSHAHNAGPVLSDAK